MPRRDEARLDPAHYAGARLSEATERLSALHAARWRIAITLTIAMIILYFGFIALIAYSPALLARLIAPGLSLGIVLGALVIVVSWLLTWVYVRWANRHYDSELLAVQRMASDAEQTRGGSAA